MRAKFPCVVQLTPIVALEVKPGDVVALIDASRDLAQLLRVLKDRLSKQNLEVEIVSAIPSNRELTAGQIVHDASALDRLGITPTTPMRKLGFTDWLLIALEQALDKQPDIVIFSLDGLDPAGIRRIQKWTRDRLSRQVSFIPVDETELEETERWWPFEKKVWLA